MNATRQDAWTEDEDIILADTVLRYIRDGKTQLEAFKNVAEQLSRTSAACGFRWNATIRKKYHHAIAQAKQDRKQRTTSHYINFKESDGPGERDTLETAILLLEQMKSNIPNESELKMIDRNKGLQQLESENKQLKEKLLRYEHVWQEIGNLWKYVYNQGEK